MVVLIDDGLCLVGVLEFWEDLSFLQLIDGDVEACSG
jgi:hypothetical protein